MINININDVFSLSSGKYITLDKVMYKQEIYIFVNKLDIKDEPTNSFHVFKCMQKGIIEEKDNVKLKVLLDYFSNQANKKLELVNEFYNSRSD